MCLWGGAGAFRSREDRAKIAEIAEITNDARHATTRPCQSGARRPALVAIVVPAAAPVYGAAAALPVSRCLLAASDGNSDPPGEAVRLRSRPARRRRSSRGRALRPAPSAQVGGVFPLAASGALLFAPPE